MVTGVNRDEAGIGRGRDCIVSGREKIKEINRTAEKKRKRKGRKFEFWERKKGRGEDRLGRR